MIFDPLPNFDQVRSAIDFAMVRIGDLPKYNNVERAYHGPEYLRRRFNCTGVTNQCAIRMSIALGRCGFPLDGFPTPARVHGTSLRRCTLEEPHIIGANELMRFLIRRFGLTTHFPAHRVPGAYAALSGRHGIVYFDNLGGATGDHIDLFNGTAIYNEIRNYTDYGHEGGAPPTNVARRGRYTRNHYFRRASKIDFIELP